jgi:acetylornithine deacetylase/succinyl-diaminopimelate desuccinylase-like protein
LLDGAEFLVITEPTDGRVYLGEKGELWVEVTFSGKAAHGSTPGLGINAVLAGSDFSLKLNSRVKEWNCDELRGCTTLNVGQFDGGWQVNIVPDRATIKLDFRVISTDQKELALNTIGEIASEVVDKLGGDFNKETISYQDPIVSDPEDGYIEGFFRAAGLTPDGGNRSAPLIVPYCTDAAAIVPELGVPLILYGPGAIEMAHKPDEYVEIKSLIESLETFTNFFKVTK